MSDMDGWVLVPDEDDARELKILVKILDQETTVSSDFSLTESYPSEDKPNDNITVVEGIPKHSRYNSPLFQELLPGKQIETVKLQTLTIPADHSINDLLHAANLVSKTQKTPQTETLAREEEHLKLTPINNTNDVLNDETVNDYLLQEFSVTEKRPSIQDPEQVLMKDVVPGKTSFSDSRVIQ